MQSAPELRLVESIRGAQTLTPTVLWAWWVRPTILDGATNTSCGLRKRRSTWHTRLQEGNHRENTLQCDKQRCLTQLPDGMSANPRCTCKHRRPTSRQHQVSTSSSPHCTCTPFTYIKGKKKNGKTFTVCQIRRKKKLKREQYLGAARAVKGQPRGHLTITVTCIICRYIHTYICRHACACMSSQRH